MHRVKNDLRYGITPAWAGKSTVVLPTPGYLWDHPRVGGEKGTRRSHGMAVPGSPPRGRGKETLRHSTKITQRITPAWAGKSGAQTIPLDLSEDHPRVGGEKSMMVPHTLTRLGSPPRGRGKGSFLLQSPDDLGITPAWAGKRLKRSHRSGIFISGPIPFHSVLHRPAGSGGSRAGRDGSPAGQPQNTGPA